jgi:hypothetical protein
MHRRLEFHADHEGFLTDELERLAGRGLSWEDCYRAVSESSRASAFEAVVERFCEDLEWPPLAGPDVARACARLHFAVWAVHKLPWEVVEHPVSGADYLRGLLMDRYWTYRQQWIAEAWAGVVMDDG